MRVGIQMHSPPLDFKFHGGRSPPFSAATPSGGQFCFMSAPTSPTWASDFNRDFDDFAFHGGRSRPMTPPAYHPYGSGDGGDSISVRSPLLSPLGSPNSKGRKSRFWSALTPKRKKNADPFKSDDRGRERNPIPHEFTSRRGATRSVSPISEQKKHPLEDDPKRQKEAASSSSATPPAKSGRKWSLKNLLLFRSASEGRAYREKDPLRKFAAFHRSPAAGVRRGGVSAHERHYRENKAASEDMKKKTFLPYKQGILGRPAVIPAHYRENKAGG